MGAQLNRNLCQPLQFAGPSWSAFTHHGLTGAHPQSQRRFFDRQFNSERRHAPDHHGGWPIVLRPYGREKSIFTRGKYSIQ